MKRHLILPLAACLAMALTYHRAKSARSAATQSGR